MAFDLSRRPSRAVAFTGQSTIHKRTIGLVKVEKSRTGAGPSLSSCTLVKTDSLLRSAKLYRGYTNSLEYTCRLIKFQISVKYIGFIMKYLCNITKFVKISK